MDRKDSARKAIYALGGVYLLVTAYNMFQNLENVMVSSERMVSIVFIVVFIIAGGAMVSLGLVDVYRNYKKMKEDYYAKPADELEENAGELSSEDVEKIDDNFTEI